MLVFLNKKRTGETLLEILIALFVLGTTSSAATFMIIQSNRASTDIQKNFQARYLAREVFEHLKMVRDTNWIRFGDKSCWDIQLDQPDCAGGKRMTDNQYNVLVAKSSPESMYFDLKAASKDPVVFQSCIDTPTLNTDYSVYVNDPDKVDTTTYGGVMYATDNKPPADPHAVFCRKIQLIKKGNDMIQVTVNIDWKSGGLAHDREYTSYLLNT